MKFTLTTAALLATATAKLTAREETYHYNSSCTPDTHAIAKVVNRCDYPVYLWSIEKQLGCPDGSGLTLAPGEFYHENLRNSSDDATGVSIKISKYEECGGKDVTQLEYFLKYGDFGGDYLDISFVDCTGGDCPGWHDGFYFKSGNEDGAYVSEVNNEHCPIFSVDGPAAAAQVAYVKWDDRQTKWCPVDASMELHICGSEAPDAGDSYTPAPSSEPAPSSTTPSPTPTPDDEPAYTPEPEVAAAEITPAPVEPPRVTKTQVVYETVYVKEKRHGHAHARRHQQFHA